VALHTTQERWAKSVSLRPGAISYGKLGQDILAPVQKMVIFLNDAFKANATKPNVKMMKSNSHRERTRSWWNFASQEKYT